MLRTTLLVASAVLALAACQSREVQVHYPSAASIAAANDASIAAARAANDYARSPAGIAEWNAAHPHDLHDPHKFAMDAAASSITEARDKPSDQLAELARAEAEKVVAADPAVPAKNKKARAAAVAAEQQRLLDVAAHARADAAAQKEADAARQHMAEMEAMRREQCRQMSIMVGQMNMRGGSIWTAAINSAVSESIAYERCVGGS